MQSISFGDQIFRSKKFKILFNHKYYHFFHCSALNDVEKSQIRLCLLQSYPHSNILMGKQLAEIIARIVRHDPLNGWPELIPTLMEGIQQGEDGVKQSRALMLLLHVSKGLSSRTTLQERKYFEVSFHCRRLHQDL